jgi:hypothetical protein
MSGIRSLLPILMLSIFGLVSCNDTPPRLRPTISPFQGVATETEEEEETKELPIPTRPDGAVLIQSGMCGCESGKPITLGNCVPVCNSKPNNTTPTLYMETKVTAEIELTDLQNLSGWCTKELVDPNTGTTVEGGTNPTCVLEAKDENGSIKNLNFTPASNNNFAVDITTLEEDMTYRLTIVETTSGAKSNTMQVRRVSEVPDEPTSGPLWLMPVTQYTCMNVTTSQDNQSVFYEDASRIFYYFIPETRPDPMPDGVVNLYCHDVFTYGFTDNGNERLEETPGAFTLWNKWDPRFFNLNGTGSDYDINDIIQQKVIDMGFSLNDTPNIFYPFEWFGKPSITLDQSGNPSADSGSTGGSGSASNQKEILGYYMTPWIDQSTFKAYCPKSEHYFSDNQLFAAMKEVVAVDTEGIYIAKKEGLNSTFILVRETLLKQIWFYEENGQNIEPNNDTIVGKKIQFYWPADTNTPFIKKSHQVTYTIYGTQDLANLNNSGGVSGTTQAGGNSSSGSTGGNSNYPPHDKRVGCVPVTSDQ